ncbi:MAG: cobalamin-binding protein [Chloroflexi bacterium]|jgi:iron complex transport system substrate-binding protein|nr:cobalamin-binding protein [Chloroflexota bacterium]
MREKLDRLPIVLLAIVALLLAGCSAPAATPTPPPPTATSAPPTAEPIATEAASADAGDFPLTITDSMNRTVTLEQVPERVISLAPSITEILFAVGAGEQVVGVTSFCNYPEEATTRQVVGGFDPSTISVEQIVALEPDLVFVEDHLQQPVIDALDQVGIPVMAVAARTVPGVYENIVLVGQVTGHVTEAEQVATSMRERIDAVAARVESIPVEQRPTVFWEMWDEPLMTTGPETFTSQIIELAGGVNLFADVTENYPQVSMEEVVQRNPAAIMASDSMGEKLTVEQISQRPGWAEIDAVRDERIYLLNGDISSRAGPRLADAVEAAARALYPDLFE